jgi:hypothetical protein
MYLWSCFTCTAPLIACFVVKLCAYTNAIIIIIVHVIFWQTEWLFDQIYQIKFRTQSITLSWETKYSFFHFKLTLITSHNIVKAKSFVCKHSTRKYLKKRKERKMKLILKKVLHYSLAVCWTFIGIRHSVLPTYRKVSVWTSTIYN